VTRRRVGNTLAVGSVCRISTVKALKVSFRAESLFRLFILFPSSFCYSRSTTVVK